jgi:Radical SAM superfamily
MQVLLIQPRHIYAPPAGDCAIGHVYMPTSLLAGAARLIALGCKVRLVDENLEVADIREGVVGLNLVGPPYVPVARDYLTRIRESTGGKAVILLGGQPVNGFTVKQLARLFGPEAVAANGDLALANALGVTSRAFEPRERLSLIPAYELLNPGHLRKYLEREFCFYVSQGCRFSCSFCAAERTHRLDNGETVRAREMYRDREVLRRDLRYLMQKAQELGVDELSLYLSNLDLMQTPTALGEFCYDALQLQQEVSGVRLRMRGLSTVVSFLWAHRTFPEVIRVATECGLERVGFGIDGATPQVFAGTRKPQKDQIECMEAIEVCRSVYGITPEALMVFGHNDLEDEADLQAAVAFAQAMQVRYQAIPRPHVAKQVVPGNDGWHSAEQSDVVEQLLSYPGLFQHLDFTALPSKLTHQDDAFRELVNKYFLEVCSIEGSLTRYVVPVPLGEDPAARWARAFNQGKYDI